MNINIGRLCPIADTRVFFAAGLPIVGSPAMAALTRQAYEDALDLYVTSYRDATI